MRTLLLLCGATSALAIEKGGHLFIKAKETKLLKQPNAKAAAVTTLHKGVQVIWNGAAEKDKQWHEVSVNGLKGFVRQADLSPSMPQLEIDGASGKPMSADAFASSGAGVSCRMGQGTFKPSSAGGEVAWAELLYVEELNLARATPAAVDAKSKELHAP